MLYHVFVLVASLICMIAWAIFGLWMPLVWCLLTIVVTAAAVYNLGFVRSAVGAADRETTVINCSRSRDWNCGWKTAYGTNNIA